ncbi:hypothetical protein LTR37_003207 [Vermiconidia calcicola]|uniref:Uncharacterized protein n=1 Tax=Vermiconidia calcicola TaxID=1690605 RepID=A0ACC3NQX6_9PEZI|nr:hypothetical protein LTR37_003207 [Vermiconidia calcicola]
MRRPYVTSRGCQAHRFPGVAHYSPCKQACSRLLWQLLPPSSTLVPVMDSNASLQLRPQAASPEEFRRKDFHNVEAKRGDALMYSDQQSGSLQRDGPGCASSVHCGNETGVAQMAGPSYPNPSDTVLSGTTHQSNLRQQAAHVYQYRSNGLGAMLLTPAEIRNLGTSGYQGYSFQRQQEATMLGDAQDPRNVQEHAQLAGGPDPFNRNNPVIGGTIGLTDFQHIPVTALNDRSHINGGAAGSRGRTLASDSKSNSKIVRKTPAARAPSSNEVSDKAKEVAAALTQAGRSLVKVPTGNFQLKYRTFGEAEARIYRRIPLEIANDNVALVERYRDYYIRELTRIILSLGYCQAPRLGPNAKTTTKEESRDWVRWQKVQLKKVRQARSIPTALDDAEARAVLIYHGVLDVNTRGSYPTTLKVDDELKCQERLETIINGIRDYAIVRADILGEPNIERLAAAPKHYVERKQANFWVNFKKKEKASAVDQEEDSDLEEDENDDDEDVPVEELKVDNPFMKVRFSDKELKDGRVFRTLQLKKAKQAERVPDGKSKKEARDARASASNTDDNEHVSQSSEDPRDVGRTTFSQALERAGQPSSGPITSNGPYSGLPARYTNYNGPPAGDESMRPVAGLGGLASAPSRPAAPGGPHHSLAISYESRASALNVYNYGGYNMSTMNVPSYPYAASAPPHRPGFNQVDGASLSTAGGIIGMGAFNYTGNTANSTAGIPSTSPSNDFVPLAGTQASSGQKRTSTQQAQTESAKRMKFDAMQPKDGNDGRVYGEADGEADGVSGDFDGYQF